MWSSGQAQALDELAAIAAASDGGLVLAQTRRGGSGEMFVDLSIDCREFARAPGGLPLRRRERIVVAVPVKFPFERSYALTRHLRFAGFPHVNWSVHLCLYQAPSVEWVPSEGMFGFVRRLHEWLKQGAIGQLDPIGAPLHPPATYNVDFSHFVIPRVDTPTVTDAPWYGFAQLQAVSPSRVDVTGWSEQVREMPAPVAAAVLLASAMPPEFPTTVQDLLRDLVRRGVDRQFILTLMLATLHNGQGAPLYVLVGTPMRGIAGSDVRQQHLQAWYVPPDWADMLEIATRQVSEHDTLRELGERAEALFWTWTETAKVAWCMVREDRPEIVVRRDKDTPAAWFRGRTIALWGCGGLGSHLAEYLVRAGAAHLILHDNGFVAPGVLVRQQFSDADVATPKATALSARLRAIRPDVRVSTELGNLLSTVETDDPAAGADVVIDTTGSIALAEKLEARWPLTTTSATYLSMVVGPAAERGFAVVVPPTHTGGIADALRRAKLEACSSIRLRPYVGEFWPERGAERLFQPEPGCSEPTFIASSADMAQLAAALLNRTARALETTPAEASAHFLTRADLADASPAAISVSLPADEVFAIGDTYRVRIARSAWKEMEAAMSQSRRRRGRRVETGGLLFGERNSAARVVWVSEASGPPPDSTANAAGFVCGVSGVADLNKEKRVRSRGSVAHVGMWHTHPDMAPRASETDLLGMLKIVTAVDPPTPESLLLIVGGDLLTQPELGLSYFTRRELHA